MSQQKKAFPEKYLQVSELNAPMIATIKTVASEYVDDDVDLRVVARFTEAGMKPVILDLTSLLVLASIAGNDDTDAWPGTRVVVARGTRRHQGRRVTRVVVEAPDEHDGQIDEAVKV